MEAFAAPTVGASVEFYVTIRQADLSTIREHDSIIQYFSEKESKRASTPLNLTLPSNNVAMECERIQ